MSNYRLKCILSKQASWFLNSIFIRLRTKTIVKYKNGWLKYDHRLMYKKYTTPLPYLWDVG